MIEKILPTNIYEKYGDEVVSGMRTDLRLELKNLRDSKKKVSEAGWTVAALIAKINEIENYLNGRGFGFPITK